MTSTISENGVFNPITLFLLIPILLLKLKLLKKMDIPLYKLVAKQLKRLIRPQVNHFKALRLLPKIVREFKLEDESRRINYRRHIISRYFSSWRHS